MKYTEQIYNAIREYNRKHQFPANVVGMTSAMKELIEKEIGAQGALVSFHGINVEMNNVSEKPLFWIGGNVDFHTPREPVDPEKVEHGLESCSNGNCNGVTVCPYFGARGCVKMLIKDAHEVVKELRGNKR